MDSIEWRRGRAEGLAYETAGDPSSAPVLLIAGADTPGSGWPDTLCQGLVESGLAVVRFDHRETGDSAGPWPPYDLTMLVDDARAVLGAAVGAESAHLIGSSMGGMVAQLAALQGWARSLTLIASTPGPAAGCPPPSAPYLDAIAELAFAEGVTEAEMAVRSARLLAGYRYEFVKPTDDGTPPVTRHALAVEDTEPWHDRLGDISVPTLVIHGADDPLFPPAHGEYLAAHIPDSTLFEVLGLGHELPPGLFEEFGAAIVGHLIAAESSDDPTSTS